MDKISVKSSQILVIDPSLTLSVRNPKYVFLKIKLKVLLAPGLDPGHYLKLLNEGLIHTIAPWSNGTSPCNPFKIQISYFSLLEYINRQSYVEEVASFSVQLLKNSTDKSGKKIKASFDNIEPSKPWMIITSLEKHSLSVVNEEELRMILAEKQKKKDKKAAKKEKKKTKALAKQSQENKANKNPKEKDQQNNPPDQEHPPKEQQKKQEIQQLLQKDQQSGGQQEGKTDPQKDQDQKKPSEKQQKKPLVLNALYIGNDLYHFDKKR